MKNGNGKTSIKSNSAFAKRLLAISSLQNGNSTGTGTLHLLCPLKNLCAQSTAWHKVVPRKCLLSTGCRELYEWAYTLI